MKELWRATRPHIDSATLHIIQRATVYQKFVVCWNFDGSEWDWGTYCHTYEQAQEVFYDKYMRHGFSTLTSIAEPVVSLQGEL